MPNFGGISISLREFTPIEKRDMLLYILGVMFFKFGSEAFNGSVVALATKLFDATGMGGSFGRLGVLQGLNLGMRCFGSIMVPPLIRRFASRDILSAACAVLGLTVAFVLIVDAASGGRFRSGVEQERLTDHHGDFHPDVMIPVYAILGFSNGMIDLVRSLIPRDMVGGNVEKLQKLDSLVHVFFTISAIAGQLTAGLIFVPAFGHNRSFVVTPICYALSSFLFFHMSTMGFRLVKHRKSNTKNWIMAILHPFWLFAVSFFVGARIMFSSRNTFWLIPGYGFASYAHRYLDTCIVPQIAKRILARPSISLVIAAGTSFGELLGALIIFCWTKHFRTPLFWLRIDACLLLLVWFFPFWAPDEAEARQVLIAVAFMVPLAFAWAAYDVSITAYVQAALTRLEHTSPHIASLSAVVCFVYCLQVAMYGSMSTLIRTYLDKMGPGDAIQGRLIWTAGVQFTVISIVVIASSFIPEGSRALNPRMIASRKLDEDIDQSGVEGTSEGAETHGTGTANGQETTEVELEGTTEPKMEQRSIRRTFFNIAGFAARARSWMAGLGKTPWREVRSRSCSHVQNGEDGLTSPTG